MARKLALTQKRKLAAGQSEMELSALVLKHLGVDVEPTKLRNFVRRHFILLSIIAHEIHAAELLETGQIERPGL